MARKKATGRKRPKNKTTRGRGRPAETGEGRPTGYLGKVKKTVGCSVSLANGQRFMFNSNDDLLIGRIVHEILD